jgi:hypothetical protein
LVSGSEDGEEGEDVGHESGVACRRDGQGRKGEEGEGSVGRDAADAVLGEDAGDAGAEGAGAPRAEASQEEVPKEGVMRARGEREQLRSEILEMLPEAVGESAEVLLEGGVAAGGMAQGDGFWREAGTAGEFMEVGAEGVGEDEGIATVILGARRGVTVTEAVSLLGVDGEDGVAVFEEHVDERMVGALQGDGGVFWQGTRLAEPGEDAGEACGRMLGVEGAWFVLAEEAEVVGARGPVDADEERRGRQEKHLGDESGPRGTASALYWRSWVEPHTARHPSGCTHHG